MFTSQYIIEVGKGMPIFGFRANFIADVPEIAPGASHRTFRANHCGFTTLEILSHWTTSDPRTSRTKPKIKIASTAIFIQYK